MKKTQKKYLNIFGTEHTMQQTRIPTIIQLRPSKCFLGVSVVMHIFFLSICLFYYPFEALAILFTISHFIFTLYQTNWIARKQSIQKINITPKKRIELILKKSQHIHINATLLDSSVLTRFACILHIATEEQTYRIAIFPDSVTHEEYRTLIVYAKWHKQNRTLTNSPILEG